MSNDGSVVITLAAQYMAMRDVVIELLALEAKRHADQGALFERISEGTAERIYRSGQAKGQELSADAIAFQEKIQSEIDRIVAAARGVAAAL